MDEIFDLNNINHFIKTAKSMHDDVMTGIFYKDRQIIIEYGELTDYEYYSGFKKVTVTYYLDPADDDYCLSVYKLARNGMKEVPKPASIDELNTWQMLMFKYSIDSFAGMTLHFNISKGRKCLNAELSFTPISIKYTWSN